MAHTQPDTLALSITQFCEAMGISKSHFYALQKAGEAPKVVRVGRRRVVIPRAEAERWINECETVAVR